MEATDSSAGDGDEEAREDIVGERRVLLLCHIAEAVPQLRQHRHLDEEHHDEGYCHEEQGEGEYGVYLADNLVDGEHRCYHVICEYHYYP